MDISVVIPIYNAGRFLHEAIESALLQPEVEEILLVNDGSTDNSPEVCARYQERHPARIRVLMHEGGLNHGAGETRNMGIRNARCAYIAFLDADDVYLPGRFAETAKVFSQHTDADAVFETVATIRKGDALPDALMQYTGFELAQIGRPAPAEVFGMLAMARVGYIHLNGLVIKRSALDQHLMFDPALKQCQDTDFALRWAAFRKLYGTDPDRIVSHRRIHDQNRVFDLREALHYRRFCMRKCALSNFYGSNDSKANREILNRMARASRLIQQVKRLHLPVTPFRWMVILAFLLRHPQVMKHV